MRSRADQAERRPVRVSGPLLVAAREATVELGLDEGGHVDAVDQQRAVATEEPRCVDVGTLDLDAAHHDTGQVGSDEPSAAEVGVDELRALQVV